MFNSNYGVGFGGPMGFSLFAPAFFLLVIWSLFWKGLALWHAGRRGQPWWFVILLVVNTVGLLEIVYLFLVLKVKLADLFSKK
jgi:methionyl-tRNA synthetase